MTCPPGLRNMSSAGRQNSLSWASSHGQRSQEPEGRKGWGACFSSVWRWSPVNISQGWGNTWTLPSNSLSIHSRLLGLGMREKLPWHPEHTIVETSSMKVFRVYLFVFDQSWATRRFWWTHFADEERSCHRDGNLWKPNSLSSTQRVAAQGRETLLPLSSSTATQPCQQTTTALQGAPESRKRERTGWNRWSQTQLGTKGTEEVKAHCLA